MSKVTLSVHEVINYTQEVELTEEEINLILDLPGASLDLDADPEVIDIIRKKINHNDIHSRGEYLDCEIIDPI